MASGSYFTLYRKYSAKKSTEELNALKERYSAECNKTGCFNEDTDKKDVKFPCIITERSALHESEYDEATNTWKDIVDHSAAGQRQRFQAVLTKDGSVLDELLSWSFGSNFTCIADELCMKRYSNDKHIVIISNDVARQIRQACEYLLSGKYSEEFEQILDNMWIKTLSDGNYSWSYWKYFYKNNKKQLSEIPAQELDEAESILRRVKSVCDAFLSADDGLYDTDKHELLLAYTIW